MKPIRHALLGGAIVAFCLLAAPLAQANPRPLVDAAWLQQALAAGDVLVLDAQPGKLHEAGHIPGAVHVDLFAYGPDEADAQAMQRRIQSWGVSPGRTVVIYDQGGSYFAPRLYTAVNARHRSSEMRGADISKRSIVWSEIFIFFIEPAKCILAT
jgi:rhodanese-related sulfurtransferase